MDQRVVTEYFQRRPLEIKAWRYVDPTSRELPEWVTAAINKWPDKNGIFFNDRGTIEIKRMDKTDICFILIMPLGYWLVQQKSGDIDMMSDFNFHVEYMPSPVKMREEVPDVTR